MPAKKTKKKKAAKKAPRKTGMKKAGCGTRCS